MMDYETFCKLKKLHEQDKLKSSQIAKELCLDQRTVIRWIQEECYRPRKATIGYGILDPFKDEINRVLEKHPYTATQVFQQLQELHYQGSYNTVQRYVQKIRPRRSPAFLNVISDQKTSQKHRIKTSTHNAAQTSAYQEIPTTDFLHPVPAIF